MAVTATPVFVQTPKISVGSLTNSDAANTKKTVCTAGANGTKVVSLIATSTETANARIAQIWLTRSAVSTLLGSVNIPANAGFDGIVYSVNMFSLIAELPRDNDGQRYLFLESGDTLQYSCTTQVAAAKQVDAHCVSANF